MKEKEQERLETEDELENPDLGVDRTRRLDGRLGKTEEIHAVVRKWLLKISGIAILLGPDGTTIETDIDRKIEEIEGGFFRFGEKVLPLIETIDDLYLRNLLKMPFDMVAHNAKVNKERNVQTLARNGGHGTDDYCIDVYTNQFFYEFEEILLDRISAFFTPSKRKVTLSEGFDSNNDVDNLVLFHEMIHAYNDLKVRSKLKSKEQWRAYLDFFEYGKDEIPRVNIMDEAITTACELELLNLLLDGELKKTVRDSGRLDIKGIRERLNARRIDQIEHLNYLTNVSSSYFKGARKDMVFSKPFLNFIVSVVRELGYDVAYYQ